MYIRERYSNQTTSVKMNNWEKEANAALVTGAVIGIIGVLIILGGLIALSMTFSNIAYVVIFSGALTGLVAAMLGSIVNQALIK